MSQQSTLRSPQAVAQELDISPASLRRWSDEFTDYLSRGAGANKGRSHRRYNDADLEILMLIKELMSDGLTYEQVRHELNARSVVSVESDMIEQLEEDNDGLSEANIKKINHIDDIDASDDDNFALVAASNGADSPAISFLTNTLSTLAESQKSILNSQAANRELLGVLIQDNFNLKEENNRLRERILEVERDMTESRHQEEQRRESLRQELEAKITTANRLATEAVTAANSIEMPEIKAIETKPGCLGMLFGRGGTQIITTARRRKVDGQQPGVPSGQDNRQASPLPSQEHPKPMFPPE